MAQPVTTELKVGVFVLVTFAILVLGFILTGEGFRGARGYRVSVEVPSAEGLYVGTPVRLAGVEIGSIKDIAIVGDHARLVLEIQHQYELPIDSRVEIRSAGMLGDKYVSIELGQSTTIVADGGVLVFGRQPGDIDEITRQIELISHDVKAITGELRRMIEDPRNQENVERTLENVEVLTYELRRMAEENRTDIAAIVDSVRRLTATLEVFGTEAREDVHVEMGKLHTATDRLDRALQDVESITSKINEGEGTIGALINDDETITLLNETLSDARTLLGGFANIHAEVYYVGRLYVGTQPDDPRFFFGNPLAPDLGEGIGYSGSNTLGVELHPQEDFWWIIEINDYPQGYITAEQHYFPEQRLAWVEYVRKLDYRFTFMMSKRWRDLALRIGLKEGGGGIGATYYAFDDRVQLMADVFDFTFGSYPIVEDQGLPNVRLGVRTEPINNLWLEAGTEQVLLGLKYQYATGYLGAGFHFTDDDVKMLLQSLPIGAF